jgi:hypothetical protein
MLCCWNLSLKLHDRVNATAIPEYFTLISCECLYFVRMALMNDIGIDKKLCVNYTLICVKIHVLMIFGPSVMYFPHLFEVPKTDQWTTWFWVVMESIGPIRRNYRIYVGIWNIGPGINGFNFRMWNKSSNKLHQFPIGLNIHHVQIPITNLSSK